MVTPIRKSSYRRYRDAYEPRSRLKSLRTVNRTRSTVAFYVVPSWIRRPSPDAAARPREARGGPGRGGGRVERYPAAAGSRRDDLTMIDRPCDFSSIFN